MKKAVIIFIVVMMAVGVFVHLDDKYDIFHSTPVLTEKESQSTSQEATQLLLTEENVYQYNPYTAVIEGLLAEKDNPSLIKPISYSAAFTYLGEHDTLPHYSMKAEVLPQYSVGYPFACISRSMNANPIANFQCLVDNGLMVREEASEENSFKFMTNGIHTPYEMHNRSLPVQEKVYAFDEDGCVQFLNDLRSLVYANSAECELMSERNNFEMIPDSIFWSEEDHCYYVYTLFYDQSYANAVCIYLRSTDGEAVTDAELQYLSVCYPLGDGAAGIGMSTGFYRESVRFDFLSAVTAAELLLTGRCYLNEAQIPQNLADLTLDIPAAYALGEFNAQMHTAKYFGVEEKVQGYGMDSADLYSYRIKK